jgi:hypothetical protein
MSELGTNTVVEDATGSSPEISSSLNSDGRVINSIDQAFQVCETMVNDAKKLILNSARITAKINGERPYNVSALRAAKKDWKTNVSTGFLATECLKIQPRLHMPIKTAKYITAASLPIGHPDGEEKSEFFRQTVTDTIRGWSKFNFWLRGKSRETSTFGYSFDVWFDEWEWRPTLMRMDKGFVPQGTEVMDTEPAFFLAKYDYKPSELFNILKFNVEAGREEWKKDNTVLAINTALPPPVDASFPNARSYEDLVRQSVWGWRYTKGEKLIRCWHLFVKEVTGKVSHYILRAEGYASESNEPPSQVTGTQLGEARLLYENLDQFETMADAVNTTVFQFGDGTVAGSWGVGQILYDLAATVEKIRCDSVDNMRMTNKMKLQVPEGKNVNDVKLSVTDTMMIVSAAQFAGNAAAMPQDIEGYELLDQKLTQIAQQKIGAFVPPIPLQPSDIKAAQINAALSKEKELQEDVLENWLIQFAMTVRTMVRRLSRIDSPDPVAQSFRETLLRKLTEDEINYLANQNPVTSIMEFTEYRAQQRSMFAASVKGDPLFRQSQVARVMAAGVGDERFVSEICVPEGDQSDVMEAQRNQLVENAALALGQQVPVVAKDNDWVHMETMKPGLDTAIQSGNIQLGQVALQHYAAHYAQGVAKKKIPDDKINEEKSIIAAYQDMLNELQKKQAIAEQAKQLQQEADTTAQALVQAGAV